MLGPDLGGDDWREEEALARVLDVLPALVRVGRGRGRRRWHGQDLVDVLVLTRGGLGRGLGGVVVLGRWWVVLELSSRIHSTVTRGQTVAGPGLLSRDRGRDGTGPGPSLTLLLLLAHSRLKQFRSVSLL